MSDFMKVSALALAFAGGSVAAAPVLAAHVAGPVPHLYVALPSSNAIAVYAGLEGRKPVGQITDGVQGPLALAISASGTLYVANSNSTITAYARGATSPSETYTQGVGRPTYLATSPDGSLYSYDSLSATIVQFTPFSQVPVRTISLTAPPHGMAVDHDGMVYVVVGTNIERFDPGSTHGTMLDFDLINQPIQLGFDPKGNFAVLQVAENDGETAHGPVVQSQEGIAIFARQAPHANLGSYNFPVTYAADFAFSADGRSLYATDTSNLRVVRIAYPEGNFANVIDGVTTFNGAVAVDPPLVP